MNSGRSIGMPKYKLDMSTVENLAPGVDSTEFQSIFIFDKSDVRVLTSYRHTIWSPPRVRLDLLGSNFFGLYDTTILP